ncbi:MAG TPA: Rpn family recombination-promoting nuclease/putative transposase, partial [Polyangiaceae bacterium]|nr:Rpn family recombination-promoting nuclease/putative transposase [Polyangiaceae bacterium]
MPPTLDPKNDVVFKLLFSDERNRDLLRSLLNAVLQPPRPVVSVEVINPEIQKDAVDDRGLVLDILAVDDRGTRTDVEMQAYAQEAMPERALYHWARLYRDGRGRGDAFAALLPCRVIFILTHPELLGVRVHSIFRVLEAHDGDLLSDALEIHTVELT